MFRKIAKRIVGAGVERRNASRLEKREKQVCTQHAEWIPLTKEELSRINKREKNAYMMYKNTQYFSTDFVSDAFYQSVILPKMNDFDCIRFGRLISSDFSDKNCFELLMPWVRFPKAVIRRNNGVFYDDKYNIISLEESVRKVKEYDSLVVKKSIDSGHGHDVSKLNSEEIVKFLHEDNNKNFVVQELITQHDNLAYYNDSSVNIVRITTMLWEEQVFNLGAILRIGAPGSFCDLVGNQGVSPLIIPLERDGALKKIAYDVDKFFKYENVYGKEIFGKVPCFQEMVEIAMKSQEKFPHHRIIGWDFTVDHDGNVVCIEYNSRCPGVVQSQCALGPIFNIRSKKGISFLEEVRKFDSERSRLR